MTTLPCGHPVGCIIGGEDEPDEGSTRFCGWCAEKARAEAAEREKLELNTRVHVEQGGLLLRRLSVEEAELRYGVRLRHG
jgi:hypothetical protein